MTIELTDKTRYNLEKENLINVILSAVREGHNPTKERLKTTLKISDATLDKFLAKLKTDGIIK